MLFVTLRLAGHACPGLLANLKVFLYWSLLKSFTSSFTPCPTDGSKDLERSCCLVLAAHQQLSARQNCSTSIEVDGCVVWLFCRHSKGLARGSKGLAKTSTALDKKSIVSIAKNSTLGSADGHVSLNIEDDEVPWHAIPDAEEVVQELVSNSTGALP
jgi:hypothetical protein